MIDFSGFGLPPALMEALAKMNYTTPTPVQEQAIPPALLGQDILGSAQTGTGKTAAFGIPMMVRLLNNPRGSALILTPTRELATQVLTVLKQMLGVYSTIQTALLIGGEAMGPQFLQLKARPRIIVGTPGRVNDHLERGTLMLHDTGYFVLDETDRMLDLGFSAQIEAIAKFLPKARQTMMFSATLPANIMQMSARYLTNPVRISVDTDNKPAENINHSVIHTDSDSKFDVLLKELHERTGSIIIFVKTKHGADRLAGRLEKRNLSADAIHGNLTQNERDKVIANFREKKHRIMVATDIAARGLDIPHIEHVINYDLPQAPEDYIHRIGRTARAGAQGAAISLIAPEDSLKWREIQQLMHPGVKVSEERKTHSQERKHEHGSHHENRSAQGSEAEGNGKRRRRSRGGKGRSAQGHSHENGNGHGHGHGHEPKQDAHAAHPRHDRSPAPISKQQSDSGHLPAFLTNRP